MRRVDSSFDLEKSSLDDEDSEVEAHISRQRSESESDGWDSTASTASVSNSTSTSPTLAGSPFLLSPSSPLQKSRLTSSRTRISTCVTHVRRLRFRCFRRRALLFSTILAGALVYLVFHRNLPVGEAVVRKTEEGALWASDGLGKVGVGSPWRPDLNSNSNSNSDSDSLDSESDIVSDPDALRLELGPDSDSGGNKPSTKAHTYNPNGFLETDPEGVHPIFELIRDAQAKWDAKHARASKTLEEGVREYVRRYKRAPPKGFDLWWKYAEEHGVLLPDEYDIINSRLEPFWGVSPPDLRAILLDWEDHSTVPTLTFAKSAPSLENPDPKIAIIKDNLPHGSLRDTFFEATRKRLEFLREVEADLPPFEAILNPFDEPTLSTDWELLEEAKSAAARDEFIDMALPRERKPGWLHACPPTSSARLAQLSFNTLPPASFFSHPRKVFIHDHDASMDPCAHPSLLFLNGGFMMLGQGPATHARPIPQFSSSITHLHYDLLPIPPPGWAETSTPRENVRWEEKTEEKLLWRGVNTGMMASEEFSWRQSQRYRLVKMANERDGMVSVLRSPRVGEERARLEEKEWERKVVNERMMDIAFAGEPVQCDGESCEQVKEEYRWVGWMSVEEAEKYKYVIDVDGNGWSSRFRRLMGTHALILKAASYREWFVDRIQPWVHYVPLALDFSDLYDVLAFFQGDPEPDFKPGSGDKDGERGGHDEMARRIAEEGKVWRETFWRDEDSTAYMYRMLLEYARVTSLDREAMSMDLSEFNLKL